MTEQSCIQYDDMHCSNIMKTLDQQRKQTNKSFCDVMLIVEETQLFAHKAVLAACSDFFKTRLDDENRKDFKEEMTSSKKKSDSRPSACNHVVVLPGIKASVLKLILDFVYRGSIRVERKTLGEVVRASCLLQIQTLVEISVKLLSDENQRSITRMKPIRRRRIPEVSRPTILPQESKKRVQPIRELDHHHASGIPDVQRNSKDNGKFPQFSEYYEKHHNAKFYKELKELTRLKNQQRLLAAQRKRGKKTDEKSHGNLQQLCKNQQNKPSACDVTSELTKKRRMLAGWQIHSDPDVGGLLANNKFDEQSRGFFQMPNMYFTPSVVVAERPPNPFTWGIPPNIFPHRRHEQFFMLPGNPRFSYNVNPKTLQQDVSSIKHLRKRKLMSAAFHDSGTDTESVGTGSIDSGVSIETNRNQQNLSLEEFPPNASMSVTTMACDVTSLKECENKLRRHQQCVM